jgi:hypothetical protein
MSLSTMTLGRSLPAEEGKSRVGAAFSALGHSFVASQQARADRVVRPYLARLPEAELKQIGFTADEIAEIRQHRHLPVVRWV